MSDREGRRQEERERDLESVRKIKREGERERVKKTDWRKEKNNDTNIKRSIVRGCAKETESERERKIWRNNKKLRKR